MSQLASCNLFLAVLAVESIFSHLGAGTNRKDREYCVATSFIN